ncbi:MAG: CBS domain-containing protein [Planctomycetota bacterium]|jgi:CBS domain-containing protein
MALCANDIMTTDLVTVTPATPLSEFARICYEDGVSGCPVVTIDGRLVGIVSKTDLLERLLEGRHDYAANPDYRRLLELGEEGVSGMGGSAAESEEELIGEVDDIMHREIMTFAPNTRISEIAKRMSQDRTHRVLIVDKEEKLQGIITSLDILQHFSNSSG